MLYAMLLFLILAYISIVSAQSSKVTLRAQSNYLSGIGAYGRTASTLANSAVNGNNLPVVGCPYGYLPAGIECYGNDCSAVSLICRQFTLFGDGSGGVVTLSGNISSSSLSVNDYAVLTVSKTNKMTQNATCATVGAVGGIFCANTDCSELTILCMPLEPSLQFPDISVSVQISTNFAPNGCILTDELVPETQQEKTNGVYGVCPGPSQVLAGFSREKGYRLLCCTTWYQLASASLNLGNTNFSQNRSLFPSSKVIRLNEDAKFSIN